MQHESKYLTPHIKLSCYEDKFFKNEMVFEDHMLVWFLSGETKIVQADATRIFRAGDIFLIPRHQLATIVNYPKDGLAHKSVVMHLTKQMLEDFYADVNLPQAVREQPKIRSFDEHPLLKSCLASLVPYFDLTDPFPENLAQLKIREAISILRAIDPKVDSFLPDFGPPGKIDLEHFMEKHFIFNMPIAKFGYLTGRSVSTFKRDFRKIFHTTPQRWLTHKRLELAKFLLLQNRKPSDVYLEIGFENLSHFSFAFKKRFGISPADVFATRHS